MSNQLPVTSIKNLNDLIRKIREGSASSNEMEQFLTLIQDIGGPGLFEVNKYLLETGFSNIDQFRSHLMDKKSKEIIQGLAIIGMGVLIGYAVSQILRED